MKTGKHATYIFALFALLTAVSSVNAATVTYSGNYNGTTDVTDQLISVSQFDPSMGMLLSVEFQLDATMTTGAYAINDGDFYAGWDKMQYEFSLMGDTGYSSIGISASNAPVRVVGSGIPDETFSTSERAHIVGQPNWTQAGPTLTDSDAFLEAALVAFIGTGDLSFFLTTINWDTLYFGGLQTGGLPNPATTGVSTNIIANVSATYEYTPVPAPAAIWLLGSGLIGLVGFRKKLKFA
jgi:hypothetical protein